MDQCRADKARARSTFPEIASPWVGAFVKRLGELGWAEGRNVVIDYRWAEARNERYNEITAELANRKVDVIVTSASAPVLAVKCATASIPIVFAAQMAGVVASLRSMKPCTTAEGRRLGRGVQCPLLARQLLVEF